MAETIPDMETVAEREALKKRVEEARVNIEREIGDMAQSTTNAAGEVGLVRSLWNVMQERQGKIRELAWKDIKATAAGALSVIPLVGEAGTLAKLGSAASAGKRSVSAEKAAWSVRKGLESEKALARLARGTARGQLWNALKEVPRSPVRLVSDPWKSGKEAWGARGALKEAEKKAMRVTGADFIAQANKSALESIASVRKSEYGGAKRKLGKDVAISGGLRLMRSIDPFPDVPPKLTKVARVAGLVLPGANIVPAVWQLAHNKVEWAKMYRGLALDMDKVVLNRFNRKITGMKEPQVARAAAAFHHG